MYDPKKCYTEYFQIKRCLLMFCFICFMIKTCKTSSYWRKCIQKDCFDDTTPKGRVHSHTKNRKIRLLKWSLKAFDLNLVISILSITSCLKCIAEIFSSFVCMCYSSLYWMYWLWAFIGNRAFWVSILYMAAISASSD